MMKIISWVMVNGATFLGLLQSIVKIVKELLTGVVNLLSLFLTQEQAEKVVKAVRSAVNVIDDVLEKIKAVLIS
jgi:sorbitol-specific phosphotransferase system component IIC